MEHRTERVVILSPLPTVLHRVHLRAPSRKFTDDDAVGVLGEKRPHLLCPQMPWCFIDEVHEPIIACEQFFRIGNEGVAVAGGILSKTLVAVIGDGAKDARFPL